MTTASTVAPTGKPARTAIARAGCRAAAAIADRRVRETHGRSIATVGDVIRGADRGASPPRSADAESVRPSSTGVLERERGLRLVAVRAAHVKSELPMSELSELPMSELPNLLTDC